MNNEKVKKKTKQATLAENNEIETPKVKIEEAIKQAKIEKENKKKKENKTKEEIEKIEKEIEVENGDKIIQKK